MILEAQHLYSLATAAYVVTSLVIASVRWFHMCHPYDRKPEYYYPARRACTIIYLSAIVLLPYVFLPDRNGVWLLVKAYFLPVDLFFLTVMQFSYFGSVKHWRAWHRPTFLLGGIALLALLSGPAVSLVGGDNVNSMAIGNAIIRVLGLFMTGVCLFASWMIRRWTKQVSTDDYSNPEDFPANFARRVTRMALATVVLLWVANLLDSRAVMAVIQLFIGCMSVHLLISALHPHRHRDLEEEEEPKEEGVAESDAQLYARQVSAGKVKTILSAIRKYVEEDEAFLDPHLTLQDVADGIGHNRTYVAGVFKKELGGFYTYVNMLRLQYAENYARQFPRASLSEIAMASGFGTRRTYLAAKAKLGPGSSS